MTTFSTMAPIATTDPAAVGFDPARLARVDDHLRTAYIDRARSPAAR